MSTTHDAAPAPTSELPNELALRVAPLHKLALGIALGVAIGFLVAAVTCMHLLRADEPYPLDLLAQYMVGYTVSWSGALIGAFWGFVVGFFAGWFFAFARNLIVGLTFFVARARAEFAQGNKLLDHI